MSLANLAMKLWEIRKSSRSLEASQLWGLDLIQGLACALLPCDFERWK